MDGRASHALLLTGGHSRRLGSDKTRLRIGPESEPLARQVAAVLVAAGLSVVEVGNGASGLDPADIVDDPRAGPLAAVAFGSAWITHRLGRSVSLLVVAADLPGLTSPLVDLIAGWKVPVDDGAIEAAVVPVHRGRRQSLCARYPCGVDRVACALVEAGERSMQALLRALPVVELDEADWQAVAPASALDDLDTPADLARWESINRNPGGAR